jgi:hypothetical protein
MPKKRTDADLTVHVGTYRSFEWYRTPVDTMPGLDAYEDLSVRDQDDFQASVIHWGELAPGHRPLQTRINDEHDNPLIVAIKAGKHRFTAFREESGPTWIVVGHYLKEGQKREKVGDRVVQRTVAARSDYFQRVSEGTYYERS